MATCDPAEISKVQSGQTRNANNFGVGVTELTTRTIRLYNYEETDLFVATNPHLQVMAGHEAAAVMAGFAPNNTRGFVLGFATSSGWQIINCSHLNLPDGAGLRMDSQSFSEVVMALQTGGVTNTHVMG